MGTLDGPAIRNANVRITENQKNPRGHKIFVRNSGAGNGCANFMGTWKNCFLSARKPMSIKFLVLGGGGILGFGGGGEGHDRNRHNRQNRQNRHGCLFVLYFVGPAKGGQGALH